MLGFEVFLAHGGYGSVGLFPELKKLDLKPGFDMQSFASVVGVTWVTVYISFG